MLNYILMLRVNIRGKKIKYFRYKHNRGVKKYFSIIRLNKASYIIMAVVSGILFGLPSLFINETLEAQNMQITQPQSEQQVLSVVSAGKKNGVSNPPSVSKDIEKSSKEKSTKATGSSDGNAMHPKPSWVNLPLFVDPNNGASRYLATISDSPDAKYVARMAQTPVAQWFGDWNSNVTADVMSYTMAASNSNSIPVVVVYSIPNRDCGGYSVGGASGVSNYTNWVQKVANGIGQRRAVVVLEPDSLGALDCLPEGLRQERLSALSEAVSILKVNSNTWVYIDAGTPVWQPADIMADRLKSANISEADGFSINVSYFATTSSNYAYGDKLSKLVGNKHYVIDTSRNGGNNKVTGMQCNPAFASFGDTPTTNTQRQLADALLWIKIPWESDGPCNGSPNPGQDFWSYAMTLAKNANW